MIGKWIKRFLLIGIVAGIGLFGYTLLTKERVTGQWRVDYTVTYRDGEGVVELDKIDDSLPGRDSVYEFADANLLSLPGSSQEGKLTVHGNGNQGDWSGNFDKKDNLIEIWNPEESQSLLAECKVDQDNMVLAYNAKNDGQDLPPQRCVVHLVRVKEGSPKEQPAQKEKQFFWETPEPDLLDYEELEDGTLKITGIVMDNTMGELEIPDEIDGRIVTAIGEDVFEDCSYVTALKLPQKLSKIEGNPFLNCERLSFIVTDPDSEVFRSDGQILIDSRKRELVTVAGGYKNGSLRVPYDVVSIGPEAFRQAEKVETLYLPETVISLESSSLQHSMISKVHMGENVIHIGDFAFSDTPIESLHLPKTTSFVGINPFPGIKVDADEDNPALRVENGMVIDQMKQRLISCRTDPYGEFPSGIKIIGTSAFKGLEIRELSLPEGVERIDDYCICGETSLNHIDFPDSLIYIGSMAFSGCSSLTDVTIPAHVTGIGAGAFSGCTSLNAINVEEGNEMFDTVRDALVRQSDQCLLFYPVTADASSYTVPEGICSVGDLAFARCINLRKIVLPEGVLSIGFGAFGGVKAEITLPVSVQEINSGAFQDFVYADDLSWSSDPEELLSELTEYRYKQLLDQYSPLKCIVHKNSYAHQFCKENDIAYSVIPEETGLEFLTGVFDQMLSLAEAWDYEGFNSLCSQFEPDQEDVSMWYDFLHDFSQYGMRWTIEHTVPGDNGVGMVTLYVAPGDLGEPFVFWPIVMGLRNQEGDWQLCEPDMEQFYKRRYYFAPMKMKEASDAGRNCRWAMGNLSWTRDEAEFSIFYIKPVAYWQNEDGSVDVYLACHNGTEEDHTLSTVHAYLEDDNDERLFDVQANAGMVIPSGRCEKVTMHIPSELIASGTQEWGTVSLNVKEEDAGVSQVIIEKEEPESEEQSETEPIEGEIMP